MYGMFQQTWSSGQGKGSQEPGSQGAAQVAAVMTPGWAATLVGALTSQRDLCLALDTMSVQQAQLVRSGDGDGLLRVLAERQAIVDQIAELSDGISPYRNQWETCLAAASADERAALESVIKDITTLVERISRQDDADRAALESQRAVVSSELTGVVRGRGAIAAYSSSVSRPMFKDQNG